MHICELHLRVKCDFTCPEDSLLQSGNHAVHFVRGDRTTKSTTNECELLSEIQVPRSGVGPGRRKEMGEPKNETPHSEQVVSKRTSWSSVSFAGSPTVLSGWEAKSEEGNHRHANSSSAFPRLNTNSVAMQLAVFITAGQPVESHFFLRSPRVLRGADHAHSNQRYINTGQERSTSGWRIQISMLMTALKLPQFTAHTRL